MSFKIYLLSRDQEGFLLSGAQPFFCNLVKDIMGNIHVNYFAFGLGVLGENVI